jgi:hypothetical protein
VSEIGLKADNALNQLRVDEVDGSRIRGMNRQRLDGELFQQPVWRYAVDDCRRRDGYSAAGPRNSSDTTRGPGVGINRDSGLWAFPISLTRPHDELARC